MNHSPTVEELQNIVQAYINKNDGQSSQLALLDSGKINKIIEGLQTNVDEGLKSQSVKVNEEKYGSNKMSKLKTKTICEFLCQNFEDPMIRILIVAAVVSIIVQAIFSKNKQLFWVEGATILAAVLICSIVGTFNNYQKQKQFEDLNEASQRNNKYDVVRNGEKVELTSQEIVVGDLIKINRGMQIPADCIVVQAEQIVVNEGSITGQSQQVYKNTVQRCVSLRKNQEDDPSPVVISGSSVISGEGKILAIVVGKNSRQGKINQLLAEQGEEKKTPLEEKLEDLTQKIIYFGFFSGIFLFVMLMIWIIATSIIPHGWNSSTDIYQILQFIMLSVALIVMAVPEGLPLAVTLALAFSVKQMLKEDNLVKQLASCQTMGAVHVICTDKTGTLTSNSMTVSEVWNGSGDIHIVGKENTNWKQSVFPSQFAKEMIYKSIVSNSSAVLTPVPKGSSTELSLLRFTQKFYHQKHTSKDEEIFEKSHFLKLPFSSERKRALTGLTMHKQHYLLLIGAAQVVTGACQQIYSLKDQRDKMKRIDDSMVYQKINEMGSKGLRMLAVAYKKINQMPSTEELEAKDDFNVRQIQKSGFTFLLLIGIRDGIRQQSKNAIEACHGAGIAVIMVTGDNSKTAKIVAEQLGITSSENVERNVCMEGPEFQRLIEKGDDDEIYQRIKDLKILARSQPEDKYNLVSSLKKINNVVAVTGDGTNDVPALIKADVGVAMGLSGTQVAKKAADIVMLNDDINCIVRAVVWGRNIYLNVRRFLQFQLTVNVVICIFSIISSTIFRQSILSVPQMLWVNLIMDSLASLALASEPPNSQELLSKPPVDKNSGILTRTMFKHIIGQTIFQTGLLLFLVILGPQFLPEYPDQFDKLIGTNLSAKYYKGIAGGTMASGLLNPLFGGQSYAKSFNTYHVYSRQLTFVFNVFVFMQIFNFFNCRKINDELNLLKGVCSNSLFWIIFITIVFVQWIIVYLIPVPFQLYNFHGLTIQQWGLSLLFAFTVIPVSIILRLLPFAKPQDESVEFSKQPRNIVRHQALNEQIQKEIDHK